MKIEQNAVETEATDLDVVEVEAVAGGAPDENGFYGEQVRPW